LYSQQAEQGSEDDQEGDEKDSLPGQCQEAGLERFTGSLHQHVAGNDKAEKGNGDTVEPEIPGSYGNHSGIVFAEQSDNSGSKTSQERRRRDKQGGGELDAEPERFLYPVLAPGAVIKTADRLETLA
jgi:hypothetical protein